MQWPRCFVVAIPNAGRRVRIKFPLFSHAHKRVRHRTGRSRVGGGEGGGGGGGGGGGVGDRELTFRIPRREAANSRFSINSSWKLGQFNHIAVRAQALLYKCVQYWGTDIAN